MMDHVIRRIPQPSPYDPEGRNLLTVAFTGYRPQKLPFGFNEADPRCRDFKQRLSALIEALVLRGYNRFISGGALGVDLWAAETVCRLRAKYPHIALELAIPCDLQAMRWPPQLRQRYHHMLNAADILTYVSHAYTNDCMHARNQYMVQRCDLLAAVYDGQPGGTAMTIAMAREQGKQVSLLPPVAERMHST